MRVYFQQIIKTVYLSDVLKDARYFDTEFSELADADRNNTMVDELVELLYSNKSFYVVALSSDIHNNLSE